MRSVRLVRGILIAVLLPLCTPAQAAPLLLKVDEAQVPSAAGPEARVRRPFFDAAGRLRWDDSPATAGGCTAPAQEYFRVTHSLAPRVDELRCTRSASGGGRVNERWLLGLDARGQVLWRRPLGFRSGSFLIDEAVLGASPEGVVLSNLTVVSPRTGKTVLAPRTHAVGPERRPVPDRQLSQSALYLPGRQAFVYFAADVTLVRRSGGVSLLELSGRERLLHPVQTTLLGGHWRVEEMALSADGRYLLLAQRLAFRGPGAVALVALDLRDGGVAFEQRFAEGHYCRDPRIVLGKDGAVGFSYLDESAGRVVLVHFRMSPLPVARP